MDLDELAIENFRRYIQIPSLSSTTDYVDCVEFLRTQALTLNVSFEVIQLMPKRPVVLMKWIGAQPSLPCIFLNSHMDVVPVEEDKWTYPPFEAHIDDQGRIYGRGTQDMKIVGTQYLEAIRRLQMDGVKLARTLVLCYVPDEELGGRQGMKLFVQTPQFKSLNIAFGLDEGCGSNDPKAMYLFYAEKHNWNLKFHVTGDVGHGSLNMENTAGEKLVRLMQMMYDFRAGEKKRSKEEWNQDVVSLNATVIEGGMQAKVIPSEFIVTTDIRLPPWVDLAKWKARVNEWCTTAGEGVWAEEVLCEVVDVPTDYKNSPYYKVIKKTLKKMGIEAKPVELVGATDARFLRALGIPCFGFTALTCPPMPHVHDEHVSREQFLTGINIYYQLLTDLGNVHIPS